MDVSCQWNIFMKLPYTPILILMTLVEYMGNWRTCDVSRLEQTDSKQLKTIQKVNHPWTYWAQQERPLVNHLIKSFFSRSYLLNIKWVHIGRETQSDTFILLWRNKTVLLLTLLDKEGDPLIWYAKHWIKLYLNRRICYLIWKSQRLDVPPHIEEVYIKAFF